MIEFVLKNRRLRLYPDGTITCRAIKFGKEIINDKWYEISFCDHNGYLKCGIKVDGVSKILLKHRLVKLAYNPSWDIFDSSPNNCIDHINHDKTDNTDANLRVVTQQQNQFNLSDAKGYSWDYARNKWKAQIKLNRKVIFLGRFEKEEDARAAYLEAKERLHIIPP